MLSAGRFTASLADANAYAVTPAGLPADVAQQVSAGRRMLADTWTLPSDVNGVWGVGPTFNENNCLTCHPRNGRARAPAQGDEVTGGLLLRLSVPGTGPRGEPVPHPAYGDQLQNRGVKSLVMREGAARLRYEESTRTLADGEVIRLRRPIVEFTETNYGELSPQTMISARIAPMLAGLGLLEAIPEATLRALAVAQQPYGKAGVLNEVWDLQAGRMVLGRFGWKANQPNLRQQVAAAFHGDIGATSELFPVENCPDVQVQCIKGPTATGCDGGRGGCQDANFWEVLPSRLRNITTYLRAVMVPARRNVESPAFLRGEQLFVEAQCAICHTPELRTAADAAAPIGGPHVIRPYTDLLLHDMGEGLADGRPDHLADGRQWRSPPLWGLGLQRAVNGHGELLHDGRARDFSEAILWHDGQAANAREAFQRMSKADRGALLRFLESI